MTELEKVEYTKNFIDKLADGINPLTDENIPEGDLLNNVRISRCMFYVSGILGGVIENLKNPKPAKKIKKSDKTTFFIDNEKLQNLVFEDEQAYVGDVVKQLNELVDQNSHRKLLVKSVYAWLVENGFLTEEQTIGTQVRRNTTEKGEAAGFTAVKRISAKGFTFITILCNKNAQRLIAENANEIAQSEQEKESAPAEDLADMHGQVWSEEQDRQLTELFNSGLTAAGIAGEMKRTENSIRARLVKLRLVSSSSDVL